MSEVPASALPALANLCHEIAALMVEQADQVADPLLLANFLSLYGYHLEATAGVPLDVDEFVFDRTALIEAARIASRDHGHPTSAPEPLERRSDEPPTPSRTH